MYTSWPFLYCETPSAFVQTAHVFSHDFVTLDEHTWHCMLAGRADLPCRITHSTATYSIADRCLSCLKSRCERATRSGSGWPQPVYDRSFAQHLMITWKAFRLQATYMHKHLTVGGIQDRPVSALVGAPQNCAGLYSSPSSRQRLQPPPEEHNRAASE